MSKCNKSINKSIVVALVIAVILLVGGGIYFDNSDNNELDYLIIAQFILATIVLIISFWTVDPLSSISVQLNKEALFVLIGASVLYFIANIKFTTNFNELVESFTSIFSNLSLFFFAYNVIFRINNKDKIKNLNSHEKNSSQKTIDEEKISNSDNA